MCCQRAGFSGGFTPYLIHKYPWAMIPQWKNSLFLYCVLDDDDDDENDCGKNVLDEFLGAVLFSAKSLFVSCGDVAKGFGELETRKKSEDAKRNGWVAISSLIRKNVFSRGKLLKNYPTKYFWLTLSPPGGGNFFEPLYPYPGARIRWWWDEWMPSACNSRSFSYSSNVASIKTWEAAGRTQISWRTTLRVFKTHPFSEFKSATGRPRSFGRLSRLFDAKDASVLTSCFSKVFFFYLVVSATVVF